ncbi:zinc metalloproteinase nas-4-like [Tubulanus polymorphus]|uniref:zinc metalloproteinase nas-4-like n=1 Tax=Tubulanus polymorphus TaxID=672921 RepID=UPI003DA69604
MTFITLIFVWTFAGTVFGTQPIGPGPNQPMLPNFIEPPEPPSIDQIIIEAGGGKEAFKGRLMTSDGGRLAELDMSLTELQYDTLYNNPANATNRQKRKAHWELFKRWTGNTIPYFIKTTDVFTEAQKGEIQKAIDEIKKTTCLKFVAATDEHTNKIRIQNGTGCNSHLGMTGGEQAINLHPHCRVKPTILHEFGHALGLVHEHQLPDRDEYLNILYENVEPDWAIWFKRIESNLVLQYEVPYDYRSIMHYGITVSIFIT